MEKTLKNLFTNNYWYLYQNCTGHQQGHFYVISSRDHMLQRLKKLKLYTKLGSETVYKYLHQNLFLISFVDYHHLKKVFSTEISHWITAWFLKSISGINLPLVASKAHILLTTVLPSLKNCKWLKTSCAYGALQRFEVFPKWQNIIFFLFASLW